MVTTTRTTASALLASLAGLLLLPGCGEATPSQAVPGASASSATEPASHPVAAPRDLCTLLTADEVAQALGGPVESRNYIDETLGRPTCRWKRTNVSYANSRSLMVVQSTSHGDEVRGAIAHPETVPGARRVDVGEPAFLNTAGILAVHMPVGDDDLAVILPASSEHPAQSEIDGAVNVAKLVYSRLG